MSPTQVSPLTPNCSITYRGNKIILHKYSPPPFSPPPFQPPHSQWCNSSTSLSDPSNFMHTLLSNQAVFIIDGSFFPHKSHLISAAWVLHHSSILCYADFLFSVAIEFRHPFAAEFCGALSIFIFLDNFLSKYLTILNPFLITVGSDCSSVLDRLWDTSLITNSSTHLHQILREIKLICRRWSISI